MKGSRKCAIFLAAIFFICIGGGHHIYSAQQLGMEVHFIDVGQGDSIVIKSPNNKIILIDGGPPGSGKKVVAYLKKRGIKKLDLLIATHPDVDHIGGLPEVMKSVKVKKIIDSGKLHSTKTYANYMSQIYKQNIPVEIAKENKKIKLDPLLNIHILNTYAKGKNNNQSSIALKINFQEIDLLLMGDIEHKQEKRLMKKYNLQSDIVKVAHHGSNSSTTLPFLKEVKPKIAIITYSRDNDFGHPVSRVIENLGKVHAAIYSTAVFGNLMIRTDGENVMIITEKNPIANLYETAG